MKRALRAALLALAASATSAAARAEEDHGHHDHAGLADAVAHQLAEDPEARKADEQVRERVEERRRRARSSDAAEPQAEPVEGEALERMLERVPSGPAQLEDLKREAAEEKGTLAMEDIEAATLQKAAPSVQGLYRSYLIQVFFFGHAGTDVGQLIHSGLSRPQGWRGFPTMAHGTVPPGALATWSGGHITIGPGGDAPVIVSHEWYHHTGHPDEPKSAPESAYSWMGREFGGGSGPPAIREVKPSALQCGR